VPWEACIGGGLTRKRGTLPLTFAGRLQPAQEKKENPKDESREVADCPRDSLFTCAKSPGGRRMVVRDDGREGFQMTHSPPFAGKNRCREADEPAMNLLFSFPIRAEEKREHGRSTSEM